jgi:hypothetical protein
MPDWSQTYPAVYSALAPEYRGLPEADVEQVIRGVFGESTDLETAEGLFDDVGKAFGSAGKAIGHVAQQAAPTLAKAGAGALSGAMAGSALGPYGMLAGALVGGTAGALSSSGKKSSGGSGANAVGAVGQLAGAASGLLGGGGGATGAVGQLAGAASGLLGGGGGTTGAVGQLASGLLGRGAGPTGAVSQLLGALGSPTVQQALSSMMLGSAGSRSVSTPGGSSVPLAAITNLLAALAHRASAEWESVAPFGEVDYITEDIDTASPEVRAEWLYSQLAPIESSPSSAQPAELRDTMRSTADPDAVDEAWLDDWYDELEAEFYADS